DEHPNLLPENALRHAHQSHALVDVKQLAFFFQAEDGIRDFHVTGVQTCALPIFRTLRHSTFDNQHRSRTLVHHSLRDASENEAKIGRASCRKECRSRWSTYH